MRERVLATVGTLGAILGIPVPILDSYPLTTGLPQYAAVLAIASSVLLVFGVGSLGKRYAAAFDDLGDFGFFLLGVGLVACAAYPVYHLFGLGGLPRGLAFGFVKLSGLMLLQAGAICLTYASRHRGASVSSLAMALLLALPTNILILMGSTRVPLRYFHGGFYALAWAAILFPSVAGHSPRYLTRADVAEVEGK